MNNKTISRSKFDRLALIRLCYAGILIALGVVGSMFSMPVLGAKCAPVQHIINVIAGVTLGPWYALLLAFLTSLLRNLLGLGSLLAFPGSMVGAFCCGMLFKLVKVLCAKAKNQKGIVSYLPLLAAWFGEVFGTGVLGGMLACPVAVACGINANAAVFTFVVPFLISTVVGSVVALLFLTALKSTKALQHFRLFDGLN